ncbi:uncharacterized protein N7484_009478 [Penicillium longicatenatum]|uniref:uncharacterized protein n=1 Tax=Penicillium longicatenatum TaxID=1561947 RepID=UPI002547EB06|nr:uncharacterized protein N7484_009478 [Penicillium longicatenatum]KAJ5636165.1 hypothetical protein N7484_009478 [Penicillium longicatenatum]
MVDAFHNESGLVSTALRPIRKKFAKPPVKVACLPCRASRTRCGGQEPCSNCLNKGRKCSYLPSKRGGPRTKKQRPSPSPEEDAAPQGGAQYAAITAEFEEPPEMFTQIDVLSLPGAGLRHLDFPQQVSSMFQGYYAGDTDPAHVPLELMPSPLTGAQCYVRTYGSEPEILNAYYDFIHCYFPILPPRVAPQCRDRPLQCPISCSDPSSEPLMMYRPRSPLSLAISAVLALIPHPHDPDSSSSASLIQRRTYANAFAQLANTAIETECDLDISSTDPGQALSSPRPSVNRERLHPQTPEDLETLLALLILSVYEYSQRGNLLKMRYRASQALALALDKSLHDYVEEDEFCEARRRAWWMTYYSVIQGAIVSTTPPTLVINDPQFTTPYPSFSSDAEGWSILIQAQQVLVSATQFIADLNKSLASQSGLHYMFERMQQLDSWTNSVLAQCEILPITSHAPDFGDCRETITARCIRTMCRIKLSSAQIKTHRFRAFSDIPIFVKRHCDLTAANATNTAQILTPKSSGTAINSVSCSCSNLDQFQRAPSAEYMTPSDSSTSSDIHPYIPQYPQYPFAQGFPYSTQHSGKICLRAAILISRLFESLPYPQPLSETHQQSHQRGGVLPRTMPSFACCLMQSSYAMFMIFYKTRVANQVSPDRESEITSDSTDRLIEELRQGLQRIIRAVSNYSLAFEALDGMRDEIQGAYQTAFPPNTAI